MGSEFKGREGVSLAGLKKGGIMTLEWSKENIGPMNWNEAIKYCNSLGNGWRLPTIEELFTLVDYSKHHPASSDNRIIAAYYWSSTPSAGLSDCAWSVSFNYGGIYYGYKSSNLCVRAVRERKGFGSYEMDS
jgi:hypothetical protein